MPIDHDLHDPEAHDDSPRRKTLFYGPWFGEFGHEIIAAGVLRGRAKGYKKVIVCSWPGSEALYADFATKFIGHALSCEGMCERSTGPTAPPPQMILRYVPHGVDREEPIKVYDSGQKAVDREGVYIPYGKRRKEYTGCIVFHARSRLHVPARNWPQADWNRLARELFQRGLATRIVCIGTKKHALPIEGCLDKRSAPLQEQMDILASALVAIGPSSGPMHLASLCKCPHFVWCGGGARERKDTGARYKKRWNPFKTTCLVIEAGSWRPPYPRVAAETIKFIGAVSK